MSALLDRYEQQATLLDQPEPPRPAGLRTYTPITDVDFEALDAVQIIAGEEMRGWRDINRKLREGGDPQALQGGIAGCEVNPLPDPLSFTASASEQALFPVGTWTPMVFNARAPVHYEFYAAGTITTVATPGTLTITPRYGVVVGGGSLGPSNAITLTASVTGVFWRLKGEVTQRATGSGTNARVYGTFEFAGKIATAGAGAKDQDIIFGYQAATGDSTVAQGLWIGWSATVTTWSATIQQIRWGSWN